ncbi:MFS transporter [Phaeobacter sp. HF9A]|nr:MFS transporter [Phaeobacter sp. HF9A]
MVLLIWVAGLGAAAQYGKISVTFDLLPTLYPDAGAAISWAVSVVGFVGILLGVVAGLFVSAIGYRRTLVWALSLGAVMSALQGLDLPFGLFLLTRMIEGASHLGVVVAAPTLMVLITTPGSRGLALTLWSTFFGVAFALLNWIGLPFVHAHGVQALFGVHAAIMAALAVILHLALRGLPVPARVPFPQLNTLLPLHLGIYRSPFKLAPAAGWLFYTCCFVSILTVLPPFLSEENRAMIMGAIPLVAIAVSMTLGVSLLRRMPAVRLAQLGFTACALSMLWLWVMPGFWLACLALGASFGLVQSGSFSSVPQLNHDAAAQSEANGAMAQAGNLGNAIGTPLLVGMITLAGYSGLVLTLALLFLGGALAHQGFALRRRWA